MYRFFVEPEQIFNGEVLIKGSDVNHLRNVLRIRTGEQITVSDKQDNDYVCQVAYIDTEEVRAKILFCEEQGRELPSKLYLFQGLPKGDKMEMIIQKAVELGAYQVIPVATKRCVVKLDGAREESKVKRWNMISESAAKQSKRGVIPKVTQIMTFAQALNYTKEEGIDLVIVPYELAKGMKETKKVLSLIRPGARAAIFIGPEGGFEDSEIETAVKCGAQVVSLGSRILRTETAGMALLSVLMMQLEAEYGDLS